MKIDIQGMIKVLYSFFFSVSAVWLGAFEDSTIVPFIPFESEEWYNPYFQGFVVFFTYIILFQVQIINFSQLFKVEGFDEGTKSFSFILS